MRSLPSISKLASGCGLNSVTIDGTDKPWIYASGAHGLKSLVIPLLGKNDPKSMYTVKLPFANLDSDEPAAFDDVTVVDNLTIGLVPNDSKRSPTLAAIEVVKND